MDVGTRWFGADAALPEWHSRAHRRAAPRSGHRDVVRGRISLARAAAAAAAAAAAVAAAAVAAAAAAAAAAAYASPSREIG